MLNRLNLYFAHLGNFANCTVHNAYIFFFFCLNIMIIDPGNIQLLSLEKKKNQQHLCCTVFSSTLVHRDEFNSNLIQMFCFFGFPLLEVGIFLVSFCLLFNLRL